MSKYLEQLVTEREGLSATVEQYASTAAERGSDLTEGEKAEVQRIQTRCAEIDASLTTFSQAQESSAAFAALRQKLGSPAPMETRGSEQPEDTSPGQAFIESSEFRSYDGHGRSGVFHFDDVETRAPLLSSNLPGIPKARVSGPTDPMELFPLFGVVNRETISSGSFEYLKYSFTNAAAVVGEGLSKPESALTETLVPGTLDTIAHWTQISRQALEDHVRIRSIIDGKLTNGVLRKVHDNLAAALVAATLPTATASTFLESIRVGIGTVQAAGYVPNAVVLNPADWASLDLAVMAGTQQGPSRQQSFWGLTPVALNSQAAGVATVGDFREGVSLFERSGVQVLMTDSHADTFLTNVLTILAEIRAKSAVTNPAALVECSDSGV